ncbi:MAG: asparagine synthase (glutamine-hydrolyzing) [Bdellovibrionales bacterium]|nr:asparagine synthase (glutamine-hydrolyzing) [Bdellovibrionales bacterium]
MCGINGGYNIKKEVVQRMMNSTNHRGPDASGLEEVGRAIFGHNRLAIIDTSSLSNQPMVSPDGRHILVFNGEIYNFKSLRKDLPNWNFVSNGDSEVLLASLATWGEEAINRLEGIFAFAWYDKQEDSLILVRDQSGAKPLYYAGDKDTFLFSSELKGILSTLASPKLSIDAVSQFLHFNYVPSPQTFVEGVNKIRPGHLVRFSNGIVTSKRYFYPNKPSLNKVDKSDIKSVIGKEVVSQLVSDRPIGVLLSGGLDSSIVLHHAASVEKIKTFSTSFEMSKGAESEYNKFNADAQIAKKTSEYYGCEHIDFKTTLGMIESELISVIEQLDEPISSPTQISQFLLNRFLRQEGVVVALGGDGGDELWGGYIRHTAVLTSQYFQKLPNIVQFVAKTLYPRATKLQQELGPEMHWGLTSLSQKYVNDIFKKKINRTADIKIVEQRYSEDVVSNLSPIDSFMRVDRELWLADDALHRTDRSSMASGVEVRVPLLGLSVINFADSIHAESKFNPFITKKILRQAYKGVLPEHLFNQPKRGWMAPGAKWLRDSGIEEVVRSVLNDSYYNGLSSLINWDELQKLLTSHIEGRGYHLNPIWNMLVLQIWARKYSVKID